MSIVVFRRLDSILLFSCVVGGRDAAPEVCQWLLVGFGFSRLLLDETRMLEVLLNNFVYIYQLRVITVVTTVTMSKT